MAAAGSKQIIIRQKRNLFGPQQKGSTMAAEKYARSLIGSVTTGGEWAGPGEKIIELRIKRRIKSDTGRDGTHAVPETAGREANRLLK
jgi:hypothetical protein